MTSVRIALLLVIIMTTLAQQQHQEADDETSLLQAAVEQKRGSKASLLEDDFSESEYDSKDSLKCTKPESVKGESTSLLVEQEIWTSTARSDGLPSSPKANLDDPPGAAAMRVLLQVGTVLLILDCLRRWHLQVQRASEQKDQAQKNEVTESSLKIAWTKMVDAIRSGDVHLYNFAVAAAALELNSQDNSLLMRADAWGCTPLHFAAASGSTEIVSDLLKRGVAVDALDAVDETPLHTAVRAGNDAVCELLLAAAANIDAVNKHGMTPFVVAGHAGHRQTCRLLADRNAGVAGLADEDLPALVVNQVVRKVVVA